MFSGGRKEGFQALGALFEVLGCLKSTKCVGLQVLLGFCAQGHPGTYPSWLRTCAGAGGHASEMAFKCSEQETLNCGVDGQVRCTFFRLQKSIQPSSLFHLPPGNPRVPCQDDARLNARISAPRAQVGRRFGSVGRLGFFSKMPSCELWKSLEVWGAEIFALTFFPWCVGILEMD